MSKEREGERERERKREKKIERVFTSSDMKLLNKRPLCNVILIFLFDVNALIAP